MPISCELRYKSIEGKAETYYQKHEGRSIIPGPYKIVADKI